ADAVATRKAENEKAKQALLDKYDPYAGIEKPAAPYTAAFNKRVQQDYDRLVNDLANDMFAGDRSMAANYLAKDPNGRQMIKQFGREWSGVATENRHAFDKATALLAAVGS